MSKLEVRGLVKRFGANTIVDQVSFQVENGEFFVLLGPSGGGKTTILRMISGLELPDGGEVWLDEREVTRLSPRQRNVGMVFQDLFFRGEEIVFWDLGGDIVIQSKAALIVQQHRRKPFLAFRLG